MYQKILVPLDGSELAECVLPHVESVARGCGVGEVIFLRVVEPVVYTPGDWSGAGDATFDWKYIEAINAENERAARDYLAKLVSRTEYTGTGIRPEVVVGKAADKIAEYAVKNGVDLIFIATHGRSGISRWIWGSVADRVLRSACVPVFMVRALGCMPGI